MAEVIKEWLTFMIYKFPTTLDKTCSDKIWKSSKFKEWLNVASSKFYPLPPNINVKSGQVLLPKA